MNWILLTVLSIISRSSYSISVKILSNLSKFSPMTNAALFTGFASIFALLISPFLGGISLTGLSGDVLFFTILMVASQAFGNILFFKGLATLEASITSIAFSSILIWSVPLAIIFLDSNFSIKQLLGIVVLFIAIMMVQYVKGHKKIEPAVIYILLSALVFAFFQVSSAKISNDLSAGTYLALNYIGSTLIVLAFYPKKIWQELKAVKENKPPIMTPLLISTAGTLGYFTFAFFAYRGAPDPGIVVILLTSQVVFSVILGIIFLRERTQIAKKLIAGLLVILAGILIKV